MKKIMIGAAVMTLFLLTGCGSSEKKESTKAEDGKVSGEITVVTNRTDAEDTFKEIEKKFIEKYPDVKKINWENSADYDKTIMTRLNSNDYGDVLFVPFTLAGTPKEYSNYFESLGKVADLEKKYLDVTEADYENEAYGLPVALNSLGIIYNEEVLKEAGITEVPTTVAEFIADAKKIKEKTGAVPFYSNYQSVAVWAGSLTSFGGEQYKSETLKNGNAFNEGQPIRQVMDLFYDLASNGLIEKDPVTMDFQTAQQQMADGKIAMLMNGSQEIKGIQDLAKNKDAIKIMNFPIERDGKTSLPLGAPAVIGINKNSKNLATAKAFLEFFVSAESGYADSLNGMTPVIGDLNDEQKKEIDESNVILTVPTEKPEDEAHYSAIADDAGVARLTDVLQKVINIGLYPDQNSSYSDYVKELQKTWEQAVKDNEK